MDDLNPPRHTYGLSRLPLDRLWRLTDIAAVAHVDDHGTLRALLNHPDAPQPVPNLGPRCLRYQPAAVLDYLHGVPPHGPDSSSEPGTRQDIACTSEVTYGMTGLALDRLWRIDDIARVVDVEAKKARQLMAADSAPPKLRLGSQRCDRWNPAMVLAHLHGDPWQQFLPAGATSSPERQGHSLTIEAEIVEVVTAADPAAELDALLAGISAERDRARTSLTKRLAG